MSDSDSQKPPCPYCGAPLPTARTRQCFSCGWDWHDAGNPQATGDPNWNRFGLDPDRTYVVQLCQELSGRRYARYRDVDSGEPDTNAVFETESATGRQFVKWGDYTYANHLRLSSGERFAFDVHGIWLTDSETKRMQDRANPWWLGDQSFWVNGIAPLFPPAEPNLQNHRVQAGRRLGPG